MWRKTYGEIDSFKLSTANRGRFQRLRDSPGGSFAQPWRHHHPSNHPSPRCPLPSELGSLICASRRQVNLGMDASSTMPWHEPYAGIDHALPAAPSSGVFNVTIPHGQGSSISTSNAFRAADGTSISVDRVDLTHRPCRLCRPCRPRGGHDGTTDAGGIALVQALPLRIPTHFTAPCFLFCSSFQANHCQARDGRGLVRWRERTRGRQGVDRLALASIRVRGYRNPGSNGSGASGPGCLPSSSAARNSPFVEFFR